MINIKGCFQPYYHSLTVEAVLDKKKLLEQAKEAVLDPDEDLAKQLINDAEAIGLDPLELLRDGFAVGNNEIGNRFEAGQISLPELISATEVMRAVIDIVEEKTSGNSDDIVRGKVLIATVSGDVHEIGKGIVASTMISHGIQAIDIGSDVPVDTIIEKAEEYQVDIIATSALLTSTLREQKILEDELRRRGLRHKYKTMVGGAPCTERWAKRIGADAYSEDAVEAVAVAVKLLSEK